MNSKQKRLHFDFGCHFYKIKAHTAILRTFSQILPGFSPNQKFLSFGWTPVSYTSALQHDVFFVSQHFSLIR